MSQSYLFHDAAEAQEYARLLALAACADPLTLARMARIGLAKGWRVLEIGPGAGTLLAPLAEQVGESGAVDAIERDVRYLRDFTPEPIRIIAQDALQWSPPADDPGYDLIHLRYVLIHQADGAALAQRCAQWLKPGGWLLLEEPDFTQCRAIDAPAPVAHHINRVHDAICALFESKGLDPAFGQRLPNLLRALTPDSLVVENHAPIVPGGAPQAEVMALSADHLSAAYAATGYCNLENVEEYRHALRNPRLWTLPLPTVAAWGRRN
ncbi:class I SAM-dependent methyltransferase [Magnetofaba australis]|uniref:Putative Methyltransferase type 11 n=1 Tax=Magnetofaba australis IT-1 TaxID=1434232 RepID=A0A1Y2K855_9PROT|nr:class I SAM-dependent methyltransferase [Magnetofaba australis]OSM06931.1 putative Methyltransferase type 11 [Magnetofaba australis IT-1]